jgi:hypothetical protein
MNGGLIVCWDIPRSSHRTRLSSTIPADVVTAWLYRNARRFPFTRRVGSHALRFPKRGIRLDEC